MFVEGQQKFFKLGLQRRVLKEIFNNLAFKSTLVYQSITKNIGFVVRLKEQKDFCLSVKPCISES